MCVSVVLLFEMKRSSDVNMQSDRHQINRLSIGDFAFRDGDFAVREHEVKTPLRANRVFILGHTPPVQ
jgi:hypothetical protein